jgi:glycyl-tRNA synthetase beta chain
MGRIYHAAEGGDAEVAQAIEEHYLPRVAGGALPKTATGALLSILDKIDSVVGCFRVGLAPTGSQDPYALRRQALGLVRILREREEWRVPLGELVRAAGPNPPTPFPEGKGEDTEVVEFIKARLRNMLVDEGNRPEVVDAVFVTGEDEVRALVAKVEALSTIVDQPDFREIATAAKRVLNILRQAETKLGTAEFVRPAGAAPTEPAERALADTLPKTRDAIARCEGAGDHVGAFRCLAALRPQVDAFFDKVMVMDSDTAKRDFRLALLAEFRALFVDMADISRIAVES